MHTIFATNVNDAYRQGVSLFSGLSKHGPPIELPSRAGNVRGWPVPVCTIYKLPNECVLWDAKRDCNPFFHLFEALWMLAGQRDISYLTQYNKRMASFSDDGTILHGAYGYRWRTWFGMDQLWNIAGMLRDVPDTRRAVLQMWDPTADLVARHTDGVGGPVSKDLPCNLSVVFNRRNHNQQLNMTVYNRSNDMIFGAYGANAVHFSFLHQYMAAAVDAPLGWYFQVSNDLHVYEDTWKEKVREDLTVDPDLYNTETYPLKLIDSEEIIGGFDNEVTEFVLSCNDDPDRYTINFLRRVACPLSQVWRYWRDKDRGKAFARLAEAKADYPGQTPDWLLACELWMLRRAAKGD